MLVVELNAITAAPKVTAPYLITSPSPSTEFLIASMIEPASAPIPVAAVRSPKVYGPPPNIAPANTGKKMEYGIPKRLINATIPIKDLIGAKPKA